MYKDSESSAFIPSPETHNLNLPQIVTATTMAIDGYGLGFYQGFPDYPPPLYSMEGVVGNHEFRVKR